MKLFAIILMSILAYATGEFEYLKFKITTVYDAKDRKWISIEKNGDRTITEVKVLQEITGDDWTLEYNIRGGAYFSPSTVVKICDSVETIQDANVIELLKKTLGIEDQYCPIQPQTITNPENSFEGYLEVENYTEGQWIEVGMVLMKGEQPVLLLALST